MGMSGIWTGMVAVSLVCALATGRGSELAAAAMEGASAGVELCLGMAGALCLWTGVMEVLRRAGAMGGSPGCCGRCWAGSIRTSPGTAG